MTSLSSAWINNLKPQPTNKTTPNNNHENVSKTITNARITSIDALRGFDMIWILGAQGIFAALFTLTAWPIFTVLEGQMLHSEWHGITAYDVIFPLFIFLSGMSIGLSVKPLSQVDGKTQRRLHYKLVKRLILLCLLGVIYNHGWGQGLPLDSESIRYASVLARIGIAGFFATLIVWYFKPTIQYALIALLLIGYFLLLEFVTLGQYGGGQYSATHALNIWFDQHLLPGITYQNALVDPEGILSNFGSIANALAGVFAGRYFITQRNKGAGFMLPLCLVAGVCLALGYGFSGILPINKTLWTSTFSLVTIGYSLFLFLGFYYLIDVKNCRRIGVFFSVFGMNAIVVYLASSLVNWNYIASSLFGGVVNASPDIIKGIVNVIAILLIQWWCLYFLYQRKIFIKL